MSNITLKLAVGICHALSYSPTAFNRRQLTEFTQHKQTSLYNTSERGS